MTTIVVDSAKVRAVEIQEQVTGPAEEAINPGVAFRYNSTTGMFTKSNGTTASEARVKAISVQTANIAGITITGISQGLLDFGPDAFAAMDYGDPVYLGDTDGSLDTAAGTVKVCIGHVAPLYGHTTPRKGLRVNIPANLLAA